MSTTTATNAPSLSLHLPDETELEAAAGSAAADNSADAAEAIEASEAAAAVEEGDEEEFFEIAAEIAAEDAADDPEATLLEEPADDTSEEVSDSAADSPSPTEAAGAIEPPELPGPISVATPNRLTPHQPPKSAALVAYEHRLAEARSFHEGAFFEFRKLKGLAKAAEERWKDASDHLFDVLKEAADYEKEREAELLAIDSPTETTAATETLATPAVVEASEPPATESTAWRSAPTSVLFSPPIPRFGKTRQERLLDACPTIGDFEDKRASIGGLQGIEGIGEELADALETRVLDWLSENRDKAVLAAAASGSVEVTARETAAVEEVAAEESPPIHTEAVEEGTAESESADAERIIEHAKAIYWSGDENCLNQQANDSRFWESGSEARNRGDDLVHCPYVPGDEQGDWLRGWMSEEIRNNPDWQGPGSEG